MKKILLAVTVVTFSAILFMQCKKVDVKPSPSNLSQGLSKSLAPSAFSTILASGLWTWAGDVDAIKVVDPSNPLNIYFSGAATPRSIYDDKYRFSAVGVFTYTAGGATFSVQDGYTAVTPRSNANAYTLDETGANPKIILGPVVGGTTSSGKPFIGTTDIPAANTYEVTSYTSTTMTLKTSISSGTALLYVKLKKYVTPPTLAVIDSLLIKHAWKLDPAGTSSIIVGTEGNPAQYYGGGALDPCQIDDIYTFARKLNVTTGKYTYNLSYNSNGGTFVAGPYTCNGTNALDYSKAIITIATLGTAIPDATETRGLPVGIGLAKITFRNPPPVGKNYFIGVTDASDSTAYPGNNQYRIISIDATHFLLRAGDGTGTINEMKFVSAP